MSTTASTSTLLNRIWYLLGWLSVLTVFFATNAFAGQVNLAWNASTGPVSGYKVYYGTASGNYASNVNVGNTTTSTVSNLTDGSTYYFAVKAYDSTGNESGFSNEVSQTMAVAAPVASFSADKTSGTAPVTVNLADTSTGTITSRAWDLGDGTTSTAQSVAKTYSSAGSYTVKLTVSNSGGTTTATKTISVTTPTVTAPVASFSATPTSGTAPLLVTLTDTSTGTVSTRTWDLGDGTTSTAQSVAKTYSSAGSYAVKLTVGNSGGSTTTAKTISATATAPTANFTATPTSGTAPLATSFTSTSTGTITSYAWDFGDGGTSTASNPTYTYAKAGTYTVKLSAAGPAGTNTKTQTGYIVVSAAPTGGLVAAYNFEEAGSTVVLDVSGNGNHGTLSGATRTTGKFGKALSFDGVNDWVSIPDADSLDLTTAMTLEAWVYPKDLADRRPILAKQGTTMGSPNRGYMLSAGDFSGSGKVEVEVFKSETGKSSLLSGTALNTAGWQHVAFVYQYVGSRTSKMTLYINGVAEGSSTTAVGPVQKNAQPLDLGRYYWNSGYARYFNGLIDEVRIYNRALSATEIETDMNKAVAAF